MWHDEPIEVKQARRKLLGFSLISFTLIVLTFTVLFCLGIKPHFLTPIFLGLNVVAMLKWSPSLMKEQVLRERALEFEDIDPLYVTASIVQDDVRTGSDDVLMWREGSRLHLEGNELLISLTTRDHTPGFIPLNEKAAALSYTLSDRNYCIVVTAAEYSTYDRAEDAISEWLADEAGPGESYFPLDIKPSYLHDERRLMSGRLQMFGFIGMLMLAPAIALINFLYLPLALLVVASVGLAVGYYYWTHDDFEARQLLAGHNRIRALNKKALARGGSILILS